MFTYCFSRQLQCHQVLFLLLLRNPGLQLDGPIQHATVCSSNCCNGRNKNKPNIDSPCLVLWFHMDSASATLLKGHSNT